MNESVLLLPMLELAALTRHEDLSLSKSSVFRAFNELERNGLLQRLPRYHPSGARRSTLYRLKGEITKTGGDGVHLHEGGERNV